ncbi:MAG: hypothetical protein DRG83_21075 [Deltaproteobacteria bacterium]|nr:MAG: hypothetical protein DRG83_21075 [Deltaproteobacteria bacterium]
MDAIKIDSLTTDLKYVVNAFFESGTLSCYTCNTCTVECPVNKTVGRLDPRKIVRMAAFGMKEELLGSVELWLCMQCRKCTNVCPQKVEPTSAIYYFRNLAVKEGFVSGEFVKVTDEIDEYSQKLRQYIYASALKAKKNGERLNVHELISGAIKGLNSESETSESTENGFKIDKLMFGEFPEAKFVQCLTCRECTVSCIVSRSIKAFDPVKIMRTCYVGKEDDLLASPELWLCISCETCTEVCKQGVKGSVLISRLKKKAIEKGVLPPETESEFAEIDRSIHEIRAELITRAWDKRKEIQSFDLTSEIEEVIGI